MFDDWIFVNLWEFSKFFYSLFFWIYENAFYSFAGVSDVIVTYFIISLGAFLINHINEIRDCWKHVIGFFSSKEFGGCIIRYG